MEQTHGPSAKIIADSINEQGHRLTTMEVVMHRFILAEMNTHRAFSRNSASSRAIPFAKIQNRVMDDLALPVHWGAEQKGMQSGEALEGPDLSWCQTQWVYARDSAVAWAEEVHNRGLHKSLCNRLVEPFMWHTAIITATEWDNFFWQRCDPAAQPEMKAVADRMQAAYFLSKPTMLAHGQWHMPYVEIQDWEAVMTKYPALTIHGVTDILKEVSAARCARVSYLTQDGQRDFELDRELYDKLRTSGHWSPFEHVASPIVPNIVSHGYTSCGNFVGWKQFRKQFPNENRRNFLPNLPELAQVRMRMESGLTPWA